MTATALAAASGAVAVAAAWEAFGAVQSTGARRGLQSLMRPVRAATEGRTPATGERRRLVAVAALTLLAGGYLIGGLAPAVALAAAGPAVIGQALRVSRERWRAGLARGAPAAARAIADALSGGYSAPAALAAAARGGAVPGSAGRELQSVAKALALGGDQDTVVAELAARARDPSWDAIAAAISMQRRAGGDLAALLRRIADVADERERVDADARTLTAQARFTARLVAAMPLAGLGMTQLVVPGGANAMASNPLSIGLLVLAGVVLAGSLATIARIARPLQ